MQDESSIAQTRTDSPALATPDWGRQWKFPGSSDFSGVEQTRARSGLQGFPAPDGHIEDADRIVVASRQVELSTSTYARYTRWHCDDSPEPREKVSCSTK